MNQKVKKVFATALCCSLLISSLNGISAVAETITTPSITQETQPEEPQADVSPESGALLQGLPVLPSITTTAEEIQPEEPPVTEVSEKFEPDQPVPFLPDPQQGSKRENRAAGTFAIPAKTYKLAFIDEAGKYIDPAKVTITGETMKVEAQGTSGKVGNVVTNNVGNLKEMTVPSVTLADDDSTGNTGYSGVQNSQIRLPGYYDLPQMSPTTYHTGTTFPIAQSKRVRLTNNEVTETDDSGTRFRLVRTTPKQYEFIKVAWQSDVSKTKFAYGFSMATTSGANDYFTTDDTVYYYVPNRRVNIYYSDAEGNGLPAYPTGYSAALSTTLVDSENYHYTAPKDFPETYHSGGRYFKFKGWYKGGAKPDPKTTPLNTSLRPDFDVTYDGNDRVYIFYDEVEEMTTTIPEVKYNFGFVDEKGALIAPTEFDMTTNLKAIMNGVAQNTGTATGIDVGNLKQLTIPSQTLTYVPKLNMAFSGTGDFRLTVPKRYKIPTVTPSLFYKGSTTAYPMATTLLRFIGNKADERLVTDGSRYRLENTSVPHSYPMRRTYWDIDLTKTMFNSALSMATTEAQPAYYTTDDTIYYYLENRRVTEHYVDEAGTEVPMPSGFTQGNQTVIDSDTYHFKLSKELPFSYFLNNKSYRFKGWYKGKTKPQVLETSRTPEYDTTFDDNDDLTVIYEEIKYGGNTVTFGFVGEDGQLLNPANFNITTDIVESTAGNSTVLSNVSAVLAANNFKALTVPQKEHTLTEQSFYYGTKNTLITIPKMYQEISFEKPVTYQGKNYPVAGRVEATFSGNEYVGGAGPPYFSVSKMSQGQYKMREFAWEEAPGQVFSNLYKIAISRSGTSIGGVEMYPAGPIYYYATNRRVTETFVDTSGAKITPPQGFTQDNQVTVTSDPFTYTASKALPSVYAVGEKTYKFVGWYKGKTKPTAFTTTATPTYQVTFDDNDDMTAVYEEETPTAALTLTSTNRVVNNGDSVDWVATLKNTSLAPLKTLTVKPATTWPAGIGTPTSLSVQLEGQSPKIYPVTATTWSEGISLTGLEIPAGQTANVTLVGTKISGTSDQRLTATLDVTGNFATVSAADALRLTDTTQGTITPTAEGFISVPTFDFGKMNIASATQQSGLKKAADYYENGTRNPYLRIKKNQPNWQMTAQLSQPKATTDSLPPATRLLLGPANVSSFTNYNEATEQIKAVGKTSSLSLTANNVATSVVANQQFTGSDVYQLDFTFANIKLEVPANQGMAGQQYQAAVTWNLVTGP
ncbi:WxL domain-containing protein [Enterococcus faecalis]|uniref:WxL domain-containing protein n=1 Tax=Enterococcus faecalis TaxID=1351 RepID=UPI00209079A4|nr:WxL domain-containing protein [Enterococcus faecalis]MCO5395486.1 WxL domain-containing protein [Enterococcus faecalis]